MGTWEEKEVFYSGIQSALFGGKGKKMQIAQKSQGCPWEKNVFQNTSCQKDIMNSAYMEKKKYYLEIQALLSHQ